MFSDEDEKQDLQRQAGRRFTLAVPITDPLGLRPGKHLSSSLRTNSLKKYMELF